jgi:hypothetical protein
LVSVILVLFKIGFVILSAFVQGVSRSSEIRINFIKLAVKFLDFIVGVRFQGIEFRLLLINLFFQISDFGLEVLDSLEVIFVISEIFVIDVIDFVHKLMNFLG